MERCRLGLEGPLQYAVRYRIIDYDHMPSLIRYCSPGVLNRIVDDPEELFRLLSLADYVSFRHEMALEDKAESLLREAEFSISEFCNYLHLPRVRFCDREFKRLLMWYFYKLKKMEIRIAISMNDCCMGDAKGQLLLVVFVPYSHPLIYVDKLDDSQAYILFPMVTA